MRETFHEVVQFRAPAGFKAAVADVAAREHLTPSCYLRRLALTDLQRRGAGRERNAGRRPPSRAQA